MATVQDIKRRLRSVGNTRRITRAIELVAVAKLRRAEARIEAMRPYADRMRELMVGAARATPSRRFALLEAREDIRAVAVLPLTGDRGLAGAFNAQILRRALAIEREASGAGQDVRWLVVGKKGRSTLRFRGYGVVQAWTDFTDRPSYHDAVAIAHRLAELYTEREVDRVVLVYNHYVSPLTQTVVSEDVLPIPRTLLEEELRTTQDRLQHVVHVMGDPGRQRAHGLQALGHDELLLIALENKTTKQTLLRTVPDVAQDGTFIAFQPHQVYRDARGFSVTMKDEYEMVMVYHHPLHDSRVQHGMGNYLLYMTPGVCLTERAALAP